MLTKEQLVVGETYEFKLSGHGKYHARGRYVGIGTIELDEHGNKYVRYSDKYAYLNVMNPLSYDIEAVGKSANVLFSL